MKTIGVLAILTGLLVNVTGISYGLGASEAAGSEGGGSFFTTIIPYFFIMLIIGILLLAILAIIRDAKSIKNGGNVALAVIAIVLTVLVFPVGLILSFAAVKKVT
jgi:hypothetical protein